MTGITVNRRDKYGNSWEEIGIEWGIERELMRIQRDEERVNDNTER